MTPREPSEAAVNAFGDAYTGNDEWRTGKLYCAQDLWNREDAKKLFRKALRAAYAIDGRDGP